MGGWVSVREGKEEGEGGGEGGGWVSVRGRRGGVKGREAR